MKKTDAIYEAIDGIIPETGAKDRMLRNIGRKHTNHERRRAGLYRAVGIAACFLVVGTALCFTLLPDKEKTYAKPDRTSVVNPCETVADASAFAEIGIKLSLPAEVQSPTFCIIDRTVARATFTLGENDYTISAAYLSEDFSGIYYAVRTTETDPVTGCTLKTMENNDCLAEWYAGDLHCYLYSTGTATADITAVRTLVQWFMENQAPEQ